MRYLLLVFFLIGCTNQSESLRNQLVTDKNGCKYFVRPGVGDTVFLNKIDPCETVK